MIEVEKKSVDGQLITIPTIESWNSLIKDPVYDGLAVYSASTENTVRELVEFVSRNHTLFCLGIYRAKYIKKSWSILPLYRIADRWQRVQIEYLTCFSCGWRGAIANPTETSLYYGVSDYLEVIKMASVLERVDCPCCGEVLPRFAIWAES